jgi:hypothetical protein
MTAAQQHRSTFSLTFVPLAPNVQKARPIKEETKVFNSINNVPAGMSD